MVKKMLKQLRPNPEGLSHKLSLEMARGNFSRAADMLKQLQKQLKEGKLTEAQKDALSKQLKDLAKQLKELAKKNAEFEKELEKMGLDKKLAKLSEKQLRQALQMRGLNAEQIQKLIKKAGACKSASNSCSNLGAALASAGAAAQAGGEQFSEAMDQLNALESLSQQIKMMQASMDQISKSMACLGQGMCNSSGNSNKSAGNSRGAGMGQGAKATAEEGKLATKSTKVKTKDAKNVPVVASWYFKGRQVKGDSRRGFSAVAQAGRDGAAEAITENQIPRKYEESVKKYFGGME